MRVSIYLVAAVAAAALAAPSPRLDQLINLIKNGVDEVVDLVCTTDYAPVCGSNFKTYSNACRARLAGVTVEFEGECPTPVVEPPSFVCGEIYEPVCGADGNTYSNRCFAGLANVEVVAEGECPTPVVEDPGFVCGEIYEPVCGADGATYPNECFAGLAKVEVVSEGECASDSTVPPVQTESCEWYCAAAFSLPVCGTDGQTYSACIAKCRGIEVAHEGECEGTEAPTETVVPPVQTESCEWFCAAVRAKPVCGVDGMTYDACTARCRGIQIAYEGQCEQNDPSTTRPRGTIPPPQTESCEWSCGAQGFNPVCGTDGKTYTNACSARCRKAKVAFEGECPTSTAAPTLPAPQTESCEWSCGGQGFNPVCGTDGKTYLNACSARCRGAKVASEGECSTPAPTGCLCTREYFPVCGRDGKTYGNKCEAKCAKTKIAHLGEC